MERSQWRVSTEVKEGDSSDEGNELETQFPREQSGTSSTERIPARSIVRKWIRERTRVCVMYIYMYITGVHGRKKGRRGRNFSSILSAKFPPRSKQAEPDFWTPSVQWIPPRELERRVYR